jgi:RimJ/RimL family protein N-acetyltransferase
MAYPWPDPPLTDGVLRLRPWAEDDARALAAAWADEEIRRWTAAPQLDLEAAEAQARRWIAGADERRQRGLALDLVVSPAEDDDTEVLGEVGLVTLAGGPARVELGWWTAPAHRRQGVATRAVSLVAAWCRETLELEVFAEVDADNPASIWVAEAAGVRLRLKR